MPTAFGERIIEAMKARKPKKMGLREFARIVGRSPGFISSIISGNKTPPLESIDEWADALEIPRAQRQLFRDLAAVAHLPKSLRQRFAEIVRAHDELEDQVRDLSRRVAHLQDKYAP